MHLDAQYVHFIHRYVIIHIYRPYLHVHDCLVSNIFALHPKHYRQHDPLFKMHPVIIWISLSKSQRDLLNLFKQLYSSDVGSVMNYLSNYLYIYIYIRIYIYISARV